MPSPESPANRMTTPVRASTRLAGLDDPSSISTNLLLLSSYLPSGHGATRTGARSRRAGSMPSATQRTSEVEVGFVAEKAAVQVGLRGVLDDLGSVVRLEQRRSGGGESVMSQQHDARLRLAL